MGDVIGMPITTLLDSDPDNVLVQACAVGFERVVIIGVTVDGEEYLASSAAHNGEVLWDLERAKLRLLRTAD